MKVKYLMTAIPVLLAALLAMQVPATAAGQVNVNTATAEQLQEVKGIGAKTAAAIVLYREAHGAFSSLDDLVNVKGIGARTLEKIRPYLTVGKSTSMLPTGWRYA